MPARRIVCLSAESAETLALLGRADRIVGVTGYAPRLPELAGKPRVSGFSSAKIDRILALGPDLVIAYSDVQADLAASLVRAGCNVLVTTQRTIGQILDTVELLGRISDAAAEARALTADLKAGLEAIRRQAARLPLRPRVWFEEWMDPLIAGIGWVDELIEIAGGQTLFSEMRGRWRAQDRTVDPADVARRDPQLILASWCGRRIRVETILSRPGWAETTAARLGLIREIRSDRILQPGPAALREGLRLIADAVAEAARATSVAN